MKGYATNSTFEITCKVSKTSQVSSSDCIKRPRMFVKTMEVRIRVEVKLIVHQDEGILKTTINIYYLERAKPSRMFKPISIRLVNPNASSTTCTMRNVWSIGSLVA